MFGAAYNYQSGGQDHTALFRQMDKDHNGHLDVHEFVSFVRRVLKVPPAQMADRQIEALFKVLDLNKSNAIEVNELLLFAHDGPGWQGYHHTIKTARLREEGEAERARAAQLAHGEQAPTEAQEEAQSAPQGRAATPPTGAVVMTEGDVARSASPRRGGRNFRPATVDGAGASRRASGRPPSGRDRHVEEKADYDDGPRRKGPQELNDVDDGYRRGSGRRRQTDNDDVGEAKERDALEDSMDGLARSWQEEKQEQEDSIGSRGSRNGRAGRMQQSSSREQLRELDLQRSPRSPRMDAEAEAKAQDEASGRGSSRPRPPPGRLRPGGGAPRGRSPRREGHGRDCAWRRLAVLVRA